MTDLEDFLKEGTININVKCGHMLTLNSETKQFVTKLFAALTDIENKKLDHLLDDEHSSNNNNDHDHEHEDEGERNYKHARRDTPPDEDDDVFPSPYISFITCHNYAHIFHIISLKIL